MEETGYHMAFLHLCKRYIERKILNRRREGNTAHKEGEEKRNLKEKGKKLGRSCVSKSSKPSWGKFCLLILTVAKTVKGRMNRVRGGERGDEKKKIELTVRQRLV